MVHRPLLLALVCLGLLGPTQAADPEVSDSAAATTTTTTITLGADQKPSDPFRAIFDSLMQQRPKGQHGPPTTRDASRPNSQLLESLVAQLRPGGSNTIDLTKIELPDVNKALKGVVESAAQQLMGARADPSKDVFKAVGQKVNQFSEYPAPSLLPFQRDHSRSPTQVLLTRLQLFSPHRERTRKQSGGQFRILSPHHHAREVRVLCKQGALA